MDSYAAAGGALAWKLYSYIYLKSKTRNKMDDILTSVNGELSKHQQQVLSMMLQHLECLEGHRAEIETAISQTVALRSGLGDCRTQGDLPFSMVLALETKAWCEARNHRIGA